MADKRFDILRSQAKQQQGAATQAQKDALKRRFAQLGQTTSGAAIKAEQLAEQEGQKQLGQRIGQIDIAEQSEQQRQKEIKEGREFARGEREASQAFGAEQAKLARQFETGERKAGQEFAAGQADIQRSFQELMAGKQEQLQRDLEEGRITFQQAENRKSRLQQQDQFAKQLAQASEQFEKQIGMAERQFAEEIRVNNFNMETAREMMNEPGFVEGLFQELGFDVKSTAGETGMKVGSAFGGIGGSLSGGIIGDTLNRVFGV